MPDVGWDYKTSMLHDTDSVWMSVIHWNTHSRTSMAFSKPEDVLEAVTAQLVF